MKSIFNLFSILFTSLVLISCDPSQNIDFVNGTESQATVKIKLSDNNKNERLNEIAKNGLIVLEVEPKETSTIYCGMGTWSDSEVAETAKFIENLEIETLGVKTIYKNTSSILEILTENRKGLWWKTNVEIKIEK